MRAHAHELSSTHEEDKPARHAGMDGSGRQRPVREAACQRDSLIPQAYGWLVIVLTRVMMVFTRSMYSCLALGRVKKSSWVEPPAAATSCKARHKEPPSE